MITKKTTIFIGALMLAVGVTSVFVITSPKIEYFITRGMEKIYIPGMSTVQRLAHRIRAQIDPQKITYIRLYESASDAINIKLSYQDSVAISDSYFKALAQGFHRDEWKKWRKVDVNMGSQAIKNAKVKVHGTSTTPFANSLGLGDKLRRKISRQRAIDLSNVGMSLKLKLPANEFIGGVRRFQLISSYDDWDATSIVLTRLAIRMGAITANGSMKHLFINGQDAGIVLISESIGKELLERNYGITNYAILKTNDVWDKALGTAHISLTDFTTWDQEQSGMPLASEYALDKLGHLFRAVKSNNVEALKKHIDLDSFAITSALQQVYGTDHSIAGDNFRLLYDFSTGRFSPIYRIEAGAIRKKSSDLSQFETSADYYGTNIVFSLLAHDRGFRRLRNKHLAQVIKDTDRLLNELAEIVAEIKVFNQMTGKVFQNKINSSHTSEINLRKNLDHVKRYLTYQKIYMTHDLNSHTLEVFHESASNAYIDALVDCGGKIIPLDKQVYLPPNYFDGGLTQTTTIKLPESISCITSVVSSSDNSLLISSEFNRSVNRKRRAHNDEVSFNEFNKLMANRVKKVDANGANTWVLPKGNYNIEDTLILPYRISLRLEPGVNLKLAANKSILIQGDLFAKGTENNRITISSLSEEAFGSFAVLGSPSAKSQVTLDYFDLSNGNEDILNGVYFSGQMSAHHANVTINHSEFSHSKSDDGLNIKRGKVKIENSAFFDNFGDQIDLDFCQGEVLRNKFFIRLPIDQQVNQTDGLDMSGSAISVSHNIYSKFSDKAISIGEASQINLTRNIIKSSNIGIAVKDASHVIISYTTFTENKKNLIKYVKKLMYQHPTVKFVE